MAERVWVTMPAIADGPSATAISPKYRPSGSVVVVYRDSKAYVGVEDAVARDELAGFRDVHLLTPPEVREFEKNLPFSLAQETCHDCKGVVRLGDLIHRITAWLGIAECGSCVKRRRLLNRILLPGLPWTRP